MDEPKNAPPDDAIADLSAAEESAKDELEKKDAPKEEPEEPDNQEDTPPPKEEPQEEPSEEPSEEEPQPVPSHRASKRIEELTRKLSEYERQVPQLQDPPRQDQIIGEGDYDVDEINQRANQYGQQMFNQGLSQAQMMQNANTFATRIEIDMPKVAQKYDILDQNSDSFDPGITALLNEEYLRIVGYDPNSGMVQRPDIRYDEYIDTQMEKAERLNSIRRVDSQKNLARQASQTGVRPSGVAKEYQGDDPRKMSTKQLEQAINASLGIK